MPDEKVPTTPAKPPIVSTLPQYMHLACCLSWLHGLSVWTSTQIAYRGQLVAQQEDLRVRTLLQRTMDATAQQRNDEARCQTTSAARPAPLPSDLDEVERILWEDLQRIFWTDVQEMQHARPIERRGSLPLAPSQHQTHAATGDAVVVSPAHLRSSQGGQQHPARRTMLFPRRAVLSQQQSAHRSPRAPVATKRGLIGAIVLFLLVWLFLAFLLIPIAIWIANATTGADIIYKHPLHHTLNSFNPLTWMGSVNKDAAAAYAPLFGEESWHHDAHEPFLQDGNQHGYHRPATARTPDDKLSPTEYAPNSAWSILNRGRFQTPRAPLVPGRPAPVVWFCRYHVELWETLENSTHRFRREAS